MLTKIQISGIVWAMFVLTTGISCTENSQARHTATAEDSKPIFLADPTIFSHDRTYYLYGTSGHDSDQGFEVYTSKDMKSWKGPEGVNEGYALKKEDVFGDQGFWAPQVFHYNDTFYMAYTANENIAIVTSPSPLGPFTQRNKKPLAAPVKQIDPFIFIDDDGKKYLYHVRLTEGNRLFVAEMTDDFSATRPETLQEIISAEEPWENTRNVEWPVAEGPSVLRHNDLYYLVYSTNDFRNPDYAVGYAVSEHPLGPWRKHPGNQILSRKEVGQNGPGHGDFISNEKEELFYVLHTHYSESEVSPRRTAVVKAQFRKAGNANSGEDRLEMDEDQFYFLHENE